MRLWHYKLLPVLDSRRLLAQHRECCALRGKGWGRKHATVDYVFKHSPKLLYHYHMEVMREMIERGYSFDFLWTEPSYRGKELGIDVDFLSVNEEDYYGEYPEHDDSYYEECVRRLKEKGAKIDGLHD